MPHSFVLPTLLGTALVAALVPAFVAGGIADPAARASVAARQGIRIVGSSTVYPFSSIVAERFVAADPAAPAPIIEATGTGAGIRLFCAGIGLAHPDATDASRRMTAAEHAACVRNGARAVLEVPIGIDGIAIARRRGEPPIALSRAMLYRALAAAPFGRPNQARRWSDVDPSLPPIPILVYGPPGTSGTRDAFATLILAEGCAAVDPGARRLSASSPNAYRARCLTLRTDGAYVDSGESDNLIVRKLAANPGALGIFGYGYLEENRDAVEGVPIDGVMPTYAAIAAGRYPGSRPLYFYVKQAHLAAVPGLRRFLALYASSLAPGGPLTRHGLIAAPAAVRRRAADIVTHERPVDGIALPA